MSPLDRNFSSLFSPDFHVMISWRFHQWTKRNTWIICTLKQSGDSGEVLNTFIKNINERKEKPFLHSLWIWPPLIFIFSRGRRGSGVGERRGVRGLLLRPEKQWTRFFRGDRYFRGVLTLGQQRTLYKIGTTELSLFYSGFPMKTPEFKDSPFLSISRKSQSSNACAMLYACVQ